MLDLKFIRQNIDLVKDAVRNKRVDVDVDRFLALDEKRRMLIQGYEDGLAKKNKATKVIAETKDKTEREKLILEMRELDKSSDRLSEQLKEVEKEFNELLYKIPNIPLDDVPIGKDESENKTIREVGKKPDFYFEPKEHWQLGQDLCLIDMERGAKVAGARFGYIKGQLAILEFALVQYALSVLTDKKMIAKIIKSAKLNLEPKPFVAVVPPVMIKPDVLQKMARLEPREERYYIPSDDLYLIGSAEHTLGAMHMDETFSEKDLPARYVGFSTSFRREAGTYGKDMKGILRVHQFDKVEMESFSLPEQSLEEQNFFVAIQEYLMQSLKIPYRVVAICTGDMGAPDVRQIDIEAWLPGQNRYRETHTADLMTDYQARRLNTKVKRENGKSEFVHMNDATVFALSRTPIAIMENYQQKDGSIVVPKVLQKYVGFKKINRK